MFFFKIKNKKDKSLVKVGQKVEYLSFLIIYSHRTINLIHIGLAKPFKNEWLNWFITVRLKLTCKTKKILPFSHPRGSHESQSLFLKATISVQTATTSLLCARHLFPPLIFNLSFLSYFILYIFLGFFFSFFVISQFFCLKKNYILLISFDSLESFSDFVSSSLFLCTISQIYLFIWLMFLFDSICTSLFLHCIFFLEFDWQYNSRLSLILFSLTIYFLFKKNYMGIWGNKITILLK